MYSPDPETYVAGGQTNSMTVERKRPLLYVDILIMTGKKQKKNYIHNITKNTYVHISNKQIRR